MNPVSFSEGNNREAASAEQDLSAGRSCSALSAKRIRNVG